MMPDRTKPARMRPRPTSKRQSRTEATKKVVQEEIDALREIMNRMLEAILRNLRH
jgi:hypothetical protein